MIKQFNPAITPHCRLGWREQEIQDVQTLDPVSRGKQEDLEGTGDSRFVIALRDHIIRLST